MRINNRFNQLPELPSFQPIEISITKPVEASIQPEVRKIVHLEQPAQSAPIQLLQSEESSGLRANRGG